MTRRRWLLALGVVVLVGAAIAAGVVARGGSAARPFGDPRTRARQLMHQLVLPPVAQRLYAEPRGDGGLLKQAGLPPGDYLLVDFNRIWRVHRSYFDVPSFVENHLPRDVQEAPASRGALGGPGVPYNNEEISYSLPASGNITDFSLDLTFVRLPHGWTGIRADALVASCPCTYH